MSNDPLAEFLIDRATKEEKRRTAERQRREAQEVAERQRREAQQAEEARVHAIRVGTARQHLTMYLEAIQEASPWLTDEEVKRQKRKLAYLLQDVGSDPSGVAGAADILREALEEFIKKKRKKEEAEEAEARQQKEDREAWSNGLDVVLTHESLRAQLEKELAGVDWQATLLGIQKAGVVPTALIEEGKRLMKEYWVKTYNSKLHEQLKNNPYRWMARNFTA